MIPIAIGQTEGRMHKILRSTLFILSIAAMQAHSAAPAPAVAPALDVPTYAFLSLIGDKLAIVVAQQQTGSRLDQNRREPPVDVKDAVFDNTAAWAAGEAIRKVIPRAELAVLNSRSPVLFEKQRELFEETNGVIAIPEAIRTALKNEKANYLILITKHRAEAEFRFTSGYDGSGLVEGLGFYLDAAPEVRSQTTNETGRGYIAPYLYAKVTLVDVATAKVINRQVIKASMAIASARAQESQVSPWAAMTSAEKVSAITRLIQREFARVVPQLLKTE